MLFSQRYYVAAGVWVVAIIFTYFLFRNGDEAPTTYSRLGKVPYRSSKPTLGNTIASLFASTKHNPSNPDYRDPSGTYYHANQTIWTAPLGKRVLIVDIDTRVPSGLNQILNDDVLDFEHLDVSSGGGGGLLSSGGGLVTSAIINHYLYALIHGYDYKFYQAAHIPEHHDTWILPHVLRELLPAYDFVVTLDADAVMSHIDVPLEWLFNRWNVTTNTSFALPWDIEEFVNGTSKSTDSKGLRVLNTGLVVAQNSPVTLAMLDAWRDCTAEQRYPGCAQWKEVWSHEQRAFSEYVRYDPEFNTSSESVVPIACDDAMGWPGFKADVGSGGGDGDISDCNGRFVRHYTLGKDKVKGAGMESVMQVVAEVLQTGLLGGRERMWVKEEAKKTLEEGEGNEEVPAAEDEGERTGPEEAAAVLEGMIAVS